MYSGRKADHLIGKFTNSEHKCCFHTSFNILLVYLISQLCESMEILWWKWHFKHSSTKLKLDWKSYSPLCNLKHAFTDTFLNIHANQVDCNLTNIYLKQNVSSGESYYKNGSIIFRA